ncbi:MAG: hypothetical protein WBA42_20740 [Mesorhizobium sp.]|jgi:cytoskeletal protein RodZ
MANPPNNPDPLDPLRNDPLNPVPPRADPVIENRVVSRPGGSGWLIALIVIILAIVAYYVFGRTGVEAPPATPPAASDTTPAPAPSTTEPAPAPSNSTMKPAAPAETAPATPAPAPAEPAKPAPAEPAPAAPAAPAN